MSCNPTAPSSSTPTIAAPSKAAPSKLAPPSVAHSNGATSTSRRAAVVSRLGRARAFLVALVACAAIGLLAPQVWAHVRLTANGGAELRWGSPSNVSLVISAAGSDDITDGSHATAIRNAISAWNSAPGSSARIVEDANPSSRARTDWQSNSLHLIYFDEDGESGYLPSGSGIVAITPVWFMNSGVISDADVIFNGQDFLFTTTGEFGYFDVQDVAAHELGHFLGLDHSGWAGATMYPYVDPTEILHRSLSQDDVCGLRVAYPSEAFGSLSGVLRHGNDALVSGGHVVAVDANGRTYASALTTSLGAFRVGGLPLGTYQLYATPLDAPVSSANLAVSQTIETNFRSTVLGSFVVNALEDRSVGSFTVGADTSLGLGRTSDVFPMRVVSGETRTLLVHGSGLLVGSTLSVNDGSVTVTPISWATNYVMFSVAVPVGEPPGHLDLTVTNSGGDRHTLVAGLEITPPDPTVGTITPDDGSMHGGTAITISGTGFRAGARVVTGGQIYRDGVAGGCTVVDANTITLTTAGGPAGPSDVVVIDPTGVEGRSGGGFTFTTQPAITSVFPSAGYAAGGTTVTLAGVDFVDGCTVTIDGVVQTNVSVTSATRLVVTTNPGVAGGPYTIEIENPTGETASALFTYSSDPDPIVASIDPASGPVEGGSQVTIHGFNFTPTVDVVFGADAETGAGGALAAVTYVDANTLLVTTPAFSSGTRNVIVRDAFSEQAGVALAAFTYQKPGGGGGGGCAGAVSPPDRPFDGLSGLWALAAAFGWLVFRARASKTHAA